MQAQQDSPRLPPEPKQLALRVWVPDQLILGDLLGMQPANPRLWEWGPEAGGDLVLAQIPNHWCGAQFSLSCVRVAGRPFQGQVQILWLGAGGLRVQQAPGDVMLLLPEPHFKSPGSN